MVDSGLFAQLAEYTDGTQLPPVHLWQPDAISEAQIEIRADGSWWHNGGKIHRPAMVELFSRVLRLDETGYWLVTPVEKASVRVADVPFIGIDVEAREGSNGPEIVVQTNVGDLILLDAEHPIWLAPAAEASTNEDSVLRPYVHVRDGLNAVLSRPAYYRLVPLCVEDSQGWHLSSCGQRFSLAEP